MSVPFMTLVLVQVAVAAPRSASADLVGDEVAGDLFADLGSGFVRAGFEPPAATVQEGDEVFNLDTEFLAFGSVEDFVAVDVDGSSISILGGTLGVFDAFFWAFPVKISLSSLDWVGEPGRIITGRL